MMAEVDRFLFSEITMDPLPQSFYDNDKEPSTVVRSQASLQIAKNLLQIEAEALLALKTALDGPLGSAFTEAVRILARTQGRIVVTGMGKSGHIANKIAATLASTGSPALFVHPAESSHGDLGMITVQDSVLALSNSGETVELHNLVRYTQETNIPLVAITGVHGGTLAAIASISLKLTEITEACPMGLAPTTSTTAMLALGDALAVALLKQRGFSAQDFRLFHPGGKLGQKLQRVSELMRSGTDLPLVSAIAGMDSAILMISGKSLGCVGVVDDQKKLIGIITDGDLRRHMGSELMQLSVTKVMTQKPHTISHDSLISEALQMMNTREITSLFVVEDGKPVGILHIHDCLRINVI